MAKDFRANTTWPRGLRNNNPGNLIRTNIAWEGKVPLVQNTDTRFEQFYELRDGLRAMMRNAVTNIRNGANTVAKFITKYAPANENNTALYITIVSGALGITASEVIELTEENIINLCKAKITVENGQQWAALITHEDYLEAMAISGLTLKKKV